MFVAPESRGGDSRAGAPMRTLLTDELPTWLASRYGVTRSAGRRAVIGISYGAKDLLVSLFGPSARPSFLEKLRPR